MTIFEYQNIYLVGIKGVAMTSIAQVLLDAGKKVSGCDTKESFVTDQILQKLNLKVELDFNHSLPPEIDCVVYTSAHQGKDNPLVIQALQKNIPVFSQAEVLSHFFNQKKGIAVCGVGGKSTTTAMITWILEKAGVKSSFSVGVGNIVDLNKTGQWSQASEYFIAEADEYVTNPEEVARGGQIVPRFSYLQPFITVCTNLKYDHPDVYRDFNHTKQVFKDFFTQIKENGYLVVNSDDHELMSIINKLTSRKIITYGTNPEADFQLMSYAAKSGESIGVFKYQAQQYTIKLKIPGKFNILNALAAIATVSCLDKNIKSLDLLADFASTLRRFEYIGQKHEIDFYDDYGHHPTEIKSAIKALKQWHPDKKTVVAFQPHTFSRTKQLFGAFVDAFSEVDKLVLLDIFPSARENFDPSISSLMLKNEIERKYQLKVDLVKDYQELATYFKTQLIKGEVCLTLGAGDIYKVHDLI